MRTQGFIELPHTGCGTGRIFGFIELPHTGCGTGRVIISNAF